MNLLNSVIFLVSLSLSSQAVDRNYVFNVANADLAPDGFTRSTVVVNNQFPGPLITANKGDTINVLVNNNLTSTSMRRSTTIHWHGLFQHRNAHHDGPAFVTQCPISPDHSYTYAIPPSNQTGTYWYHSHLSSQYLDGLRGPIVINPEDPHRGLYDVDDESTVIVLADWFHAPSHELLAAYTSPMNTAGNEQLPRSGTINGVGRTSTDPEPPRPVFTVTPGLRYRFRIINASAIAQFRFQISGHKMTVIEVDGENHVPLTVDRLLLQPGQRYSVVVVADQPVDNYWIRAPMTTRVPNPPPANWVRDSDNVNAILHYVGAVDAEPAVSPPALNGTVLEEHLLVPQSNPAAPGQPVAGGVDQVFNLRFQPAIDSESLHWLVNGVQYKPPTVPTLLNILSGARDKLDFGLNENTLTIRRGAVVEINIFGSPHPWHLHGHSFSVVKGATGPVNYINPPRRDVTLSSPSGVTLRFTADNPGPWLLHCHIDLHFDSGLAVVFAEAPEDIAAGADSVDPGDDWDGLCPIYNALAPEDK